MIFRIDIHTPLGRAGRFHELNEAVERALAIRSDT